MIQLDNVIKVYQSDVAKRKVLRGVSLTIEDGEFCALMGTSGSGKTTLLNVIGGLDQDYDGVCSIGGKDLRTLKDKEISALRNATIGFVFQFHNLMPHLTVGENIALVSYFGRARTKEETASRVTDSLQKVGLAGTEHKYPRQLSGGEQQRVAIARALFNDPKLILCDEPTGSLDKATGDMVLELFGSLNREAGITILLVTHEPRVADHATRLIRIEDGLIKE